ncbi:MAG: hypothetical protein AAF270_03115 [Pseudomonadota bacterium]
MTLDENFLRSAAARKARRGRTGVTLGSARRALARVDSTGFPVATEMAEWISQHWPAQRIAMLGREHVEYYRRALMLVMIERDRDLS